MQKAILFMSCLFLAVAMTACGGANKVSTTDGDPIKDGDLAGVWKLIAADENGKKTSGEDKLFALDYAVYWVVFGAEGDVTLSFSPDRGGIDSEMVYEVKDNQIIFETSGEPLIGITAKIDGGKLIVVDDQTDTGGKKYVFTLSPHRQPQND